MALFTRSLAILMLATSLHGLAQAQTSNENGLRLRSVSRGTQTRLMPGGTVVLQASVINLGDSIAEGKIVAVVSGETAETSARLVKLAPGTSDNVDVYVKLPQSLAGKESAEIEFTMYVKEGNREVILQQNGQPAKYVITLSVNRLPTLAAMVMDPPAQELPRWYWPQNPPSASYEFAIATRIDAGNTRQAANFDATALPVNSIDWAIADVVMIGEKRALDDAAFVESLKRYVAQGGKAWIMLDRVSTEAVRPLLGAGQICETVDEIELNHFVVERNNASVEFAEVDRTVDSVDPRVFKRVIQSGGRVSHQIDGWPAAIWMPMGYGQILLTTLDCAGWTKIRQQSSYELLYQSQFEAADWAKDLAAQINDPRANRPLQESVQYPLKHIGNPIVPRSWVALALSGFCILLAVLGAWRSFAGELSLLGLLAPGAALVVSTVLMVASTYVRRDTPESNSRLQVIQVVDDGNTALVNEHAAVHLESSAAMKLESKVDGNATIGENMKSGIKKFVVTDFQQWNLENDTWPTGTWEYRSEYATSVENKIVSASLTSRGVELAIPDLPSPIEDPVLGFTVGKPMLCDGNGDSLFSDGTLQADGERWISGTIISDEQQRRLEVYQQFFTAGERVSQLDRVLYGWTAPWTGGPTWSKSLEGKGAAFVALPVRLRRPSRGQEVFVPYGLIGIRRNPSASGQTFAFDVRSGKWARELTMTLNAEMQFVLPTELVPFKASSIEMELDITAPSRTVRILSTGGEGEPIEIVKLENPSIPWSGTLTDPQILQDLEDGQLDVIVEVSERTDVENPLAATSVVAWEVDKFQVSVRGSVGQSSTISGAE